ncbi:unnamed protein product [Vicia faba]|uniref:non-specific serine/threonine protein kinase n=1 Tax=Vicia faba TaxID=3906 RepID=A0AAV0YV46_VICFA|nr:unnamed protein product [Vicia faba]
MKSFSLFSTILFYIHLLCLFTLCLMCFGPNKVAAVTILGNQTDHFALLKFKESISVDPYRTLKSWNSSIHFCKWFGITCNPMHQRVIELTLDGSELHGSLSPYVGNLTFLKILYLRNNSFFGEIPQELGQLLHLQQLFLTNNSFAGNLSSLMRFTCASNNIQGDIPQEICLLKNLSILLLENNLHGTLPLNTFNNLPNLQKFEIGGNHFSGPITSMMNASAIALFDISGNHFAGQVPSLGSLKYLQYLNLEDNNLGNNSTEDLEFLKSLTNCRILYGVSIATNNFGGILPNTIGNLSTELKLLFLGNNMISGQIPSELGCLVGLILLSMGGNQFEGNIPATFGMFQKMQVLVLNENKLSGDIPHFISNLSQLYHLELHHNIFGGNIPPSIGSCQKLQYLDLSQNKLKGTIPLEVFNLLSLTNLLDLSHNSLSGSLPGEVGMLKNIDKLDVSNNHLSGDIPISIGECVSLEYLLLQGNSFNGTIPSSLAFLKGLLYLDLSKNRLSGSIPDVIQNISGLKHLNISFNMLEGKVPTNGVFGNASQVAMIGNNKLCGGILQMRLPPCSIKDMKHTRHHKIMLVVVGVLSFLLIFSIFLTIYWMRKRNQERSFDSPTIDQLDKVSYRDLHRGTGGFSITNLIGSGSFGSVYKGNLVSEDNFVAIKVLNLQKKGAHKSFILECNALKNIRHRNLVKIITCCSSSDYKGQEFKALVFDYMKNGSLEEWLHPEILNAENQATLDLTHRVNIITDVALALHYLHQECEQLIIHCDLKPSNVLLDDDMVAHVSDFGIARLVSVIEGTSHKETSTIGIKGTIGYAPPEYGMGCEVSACGDMYSFGILMLEMFTGRRPTNEVFENGQNLHNYVATSFPDKVLKILDPRLVSRVVTEKIQDENCEILIPNVEECLISLLRIGLLCSMESPRERMNIVEVTRELSIIKNTSLAGVRTYN